MNFLSKNGYINTMVYIVIVRVHRYIQLLFLSKIETKPPKIGLACREKGS